MKLVIAEKPMLGRDIARAICGREVPEKARLPISGNGYVVCALAGHVLELVEPGDIDPRWRWDGEFDETRLPIVVDDWPKRPIEGKEGIIEQVSGLLGECESVIHAGDPDDEGQLLVDELLDYLGYAGPVERVLVNDNIEANIRAAFGRLEDNTRYRPLSAAAYARQMADMAFGVSESRLAGMRLKAKVSVGRVQTPTLGLVVARDRAIEGHEQRAFYTLVVHVAVDGGETAAFKLRPSDDLLAGDKHIWSPDPLEAAAAALQGRDLAFETTARGGQKLPPLPYDLTTLQADLSKRHGMTAKQTLEATQRLRDEHHAITYNRSDCRYLPEEYHAQAPATLSAAFANIGRSWAVDPSIRGRAFDDSKVGAHGAIIPQETSFDAKRLRDHDRWAYEAIVERYAMQFSHPLAYEECSSSIPCEAGALEHKARRVTDAGFTAVFGEPEEEPGEDELSPGWISPGRHEGAVASCEVGEGKTSPPKPYTEGTLVTDMASAAKYVADPALKAALKAKDEGKAGEHGGIGTTATRADVLERLKARGFIEDANGKIRSTEKGRAFYDLVPADIRGADLTARWWLIQQEVAAGRADVNAVQRAVAEAFEAHREEAYAGKSLASPGKPVGTCPRCGARVLSRGKVFSCESNKSIRRDDGSWEQESGCGFKVFAVVAGKRLTDVQASALLAGKSPLVKGLTSKAGKKFEARLKLGEDGSVEFVFDGAKRPKKRRPWPINRG